MNEEEFNLSEQAIDPEFVDNNAKYYHEEDVKEFIRRRIERTKLIIKLYPYESGEELAGELNEDLLKDVGENLK